MPEQTAKKQIREAVLRWHPDKFNQRFGFALLPADKERVMERVATVSFSYQLISG